jgi:hypothetical protein
MFKYRTFQYRTESEIEKHDLMKLIVFLILLGIIGILLLRASLLLKTQTFIDRPANNATLTAGEAFTISGRGQAGRTVEILIDDQSRGTTEIAGNGAWSFNTRLFNVGDYTLHAQLTEDSDNPLANAQAVSLAVVPPVVIPEAEVRVGIPTLILPSQGFTTSSFNIRGTAEPGTTVEVLVDGEVAFTTTTRRDGSWSTTAQLENAGNYQIQARAINADGISSQSNSAVNFNVIAPTAALTMGTPTFATSKDATDNVSGTLSLSGTGEPGATVQIFWNGMQIGETTVDGDGSWTFDTDLTQPSDTYTLQSRMVDGSGRTLGTEQAAEIEWTGVLAVAPPSVTFFELSERGSYRFRGTGTPGSVVELDVDGEVIRTARVLPNGNWAFGGSLDVGDHTLVIRSLNEDGSEAGLSEVQNVTVSPLAVTINGESDLEGNAVFSGTGVPGSTIDVLIDGELVGTAEVGDDGTWTLTTDLPFGAYDVVAEDAANGLTGDLTFDHAGTLTVEAEADGAGNAVFSGTGIPGATIDVLVDGAVVGSAVVGDDGTWTLTTELPFGDYEVTAQDTTNGLEASLAFNNAEVVENAGTLTVLFVREPGSGGGSGDGSGDGDGQGGGNGSGGPGAFAFGAPAVEIILDASWSMRNPELPENGGEEGIDRIDVAKTGLTTIIEETLPDGTQVALRSFGNIEGNLSCRTDLMYDLQTLDRNALLAVANEIEPQFNANTAIAASLLAVPNDMADANAPILVVLLTDGLETCGGDVDAAIANLQAQGIDVRVDVVGVVIEDDVARAEFQRWAELGGGVYYDATDADSFAEALNDIFIRNIDITFRVLDSEGTEVATGVVGGDPLALAPGVYQIELSGDPDNPIEVTIESDAETEVGIMP